VGVDKLKKPAPEGYPDEGSRNLQFAAMLEQLQVTSEEGAAQRRPDAGGLGEGGTPGERTTPLVASSRPMPQSRTAVEVREEDPMEGKLTIEQISLLFMLQDGEQGNLGGSELATKLGMSEHQIQNITDHYADPRNIKYNLTPSTPTLPPPPEASAARPL
jgi:hypothetical protein